MLRERHRLAAPVAVGALLSWLTASAATPLALAAAPPQAAMDGFAADHRRDLAANPADLTLTLRLMDERPSFHQGEVIPVELAFASTAAQRYFFDGALYDRGGRLDVDEIHLDPQDGVEDPLWDYFANQTFFMGGGVRQVGALREQPSLVGSELNEWVRFNRPGRYRLYVVSHRVQRLRQSGDPAGEGPPIPVASNIVELTVAAADPEWSAAALAGAGQILDTSDDAAVRATACRTLRFLGTPAAAREMALRLDDDDGRCAGDLMLGLISSPERQVAIRAMEERLAAPGGQVSSWFLSSLAELAIDPERTVHLSQGIFGRSPRGSLAPAVHQAQQAKERASLDRYASRLLAALPRKTGRAKAVGALTLLDLTAKDCAATTCLPPALAAGLQAQIAAAFLDLSAAQQQQYLGWRWETVRSPPMAEALRRIYETAQPSPYDGDQDLPTLALRRLFELRPDEAVALLREEIQLPAPRLGLPALGLLPAEAVETLASLIVDHLEALPPDQRGLDQLSFLVARYAPRDVLPRVQAYYENRLNPWMCLQAPFIAYFLRVAPAVGSAKLSEVLDTPPASGHPSCAHEVLGRVSKLVYTPEVEALAVSNLEAPDLEVAIDAVKVLGRLGSVEVQAPLRRRLEELHTQGRGLPGERDPTADRSEEALAHELQLALVPSLP
jgi:hypothetical protein